MTFGEVWEFLSENSEHKVLRSRITLGDILHNMLECKQEVIDAKAEITALTARAEQAERERDAAVADCERAIKAIYDQRTCYLCFYYNDGKGCTCPPPYDGFVSPCFPTWRGLPQKGEGK